MDAPTRPEPPRRVRRRPLALAGRIARLALSGRDRTADLVAASYDRIAPGYDAAWTDHMRDLTAGLLDALGPVEGKRCLDLACGTGFVAAELERRGASEVTGVDRSAGMLDVARAHNGTRCVFLEADAAEHVAAASPGSLDIVTCAWALGYTRPWKVLRCAARALAPGGRIAVIDNSLFSLAGVVWCSLLAFAEMPAALDHVCRVRFLPGPRSLALLLRLSGLRVRERWGGSRTFRVPGGAAAIARLRGTGAAAGFEFAAAPGTEDEAFRKFERTIEDRRGGPGGVRIVHRYLAAIGEKR